MRTRIIDLSHEQNLHSLLRRVRNICIEHDARCSDQWVQEEGMMITNVFDRGEVVELRVILPEFYVALQAGGQ